MNTFYYSILDNSKLQVQLLIHSSFKANKSNSDNVIGKLDSSNSPEAYSSTFKLAILLHPYGPLGGCKEDGVIQYLSSNLYELGYIVAMPNMRGVGLSEGRTSWTGRSECEDLCSLVSLFLDPNTKSSWDEKKKFNVPDPRRQRCTEVLIIGYSYGSMIASSLNQDHIKSFIKLEDGSSGHDSFIPKIRIVLLSYPVSVTWALSLWKNNQFSQDLSNLLLQAQKEENRDGKLKVLIIFGHSDQFSSFTNFKKWLEKNMVFSLKTSLSDSENNHNDSNVLALSNAQADHFWRQQVLLDWVAAEIKIWLKL